MSRQISELETILQQLIVEHRKLLGLLETQQAAMKTCDLKKMDESANGVEACRFASAAWNSAAGPSSGSLRKLYKLEGEVTLGKTGRPASASRRSTDEAAQ